MLLNFLLDQYANHERSFESLEAAFEKLLMTSFKNRKKMKINLKSRLKKNLLSFVEIPPPVIILRQLFLFTFMACWSVMNSADQAGSAFQVALSCGDCNYFLNDKKKSFPRAAIIGFGALVGGWFCGSVAVPLIPSFLLQPTWTLELLTSLVVYVFFFLACSFLK